jgi:hypothetical protein
MPKPRIVGATPPTKTDGFRGAANSGQTHIAAVPQPSPARKCPNCGIGVGDAATVCWQCKARLDGRVEQRGDAVGRRGWKLAMALSIVIILAFFLPYATYSESDIDYYGHETSTELSISGWELANGAIHRTILGFSITLEIGGGYPVLWLVPLAALAGFFISLISRIPRRPLLLGAVSVIALAAAVGGYAQLTMGETPHIFSDGALYPSYGLVATIVMAAIMALVGFKPYLATMRSMGR